MRSHVADERLFFSTEDRRRGMDRHNLKKKGVNVVYGLFEALALLTQALDHGYETRSDQNRRRRSAGCEFAMIELVRFLPSEQNVPYLL